MEPHTQQPQQQATPAKAGPFVHTVKEHPRYFEDLILGRPWELRRNDRKYNRGDGLRVREWDPNADDGAGGRGRATGRWALSRISWTSEEHAHVFLLPLDLVLFGVELLQIGYGEQSFDPEATLRALQTQPAGELELVIPSGARRTCEACASPLEPLAIGARCRRCARTVELGARFPAGLSPQRRLYRCAVATCPGLPYRASDIAHPCREGQP